MPLKAAGDVICKGPAGKNLRGGRLQTDLQHALMSRRGNINRYDADEHSREGWQTLFGSVRAFCREHVITGDVISWAIRILPPGPQQCLLMQQAGVPETAPDDG